MRCTNCKNKLLQKSNGVTRLRTQGQMVFDELGNCRTQCFWCKSDVTVPIRLTEEAPTEVERFVLRPPRKQS